MDLLPPRHPIAQACQTEGQENLFSNIYGGFI